jgi:hypothetical protein
MPVPSEKLIPPVAIERGAPGDRERARELLGASLATSQELGLKSWLDMGPELKLQLQGVASGTLSANRSIDAVTASIGARGLDLSVRAAPDGTVTLMFSGIEGVTPMTEHLGDLKARDVVREHNEIVHEARQRHGGLEVEMYGAAFLLAFEGAREGALCAIELQRAFAERNRTADVPLRIRLAAARRGPLLRTHGHPDLAHRLAGGRRRDPGILGGQADHQRRGRSPLRQRTRGRAQGHLGSTATRGSGVAVANRRCVRTRGPYSSFSPATRSPSSQRARKSGSVVGFCRWTFRRERSGSNRTASSSAFLASSRRPSCA